MAKPKKAKAPKKAEGKAATETGDKGEASGKKGIGGILGQAVTLLALGAASFGVVYFLPQDASAPQIAEIDTHATEKPAEYDFHRNVEFAELNPFTVSLRDGSTILKIGIVLEVYEGTAYGIDPQDPQIRNAFMGYLRAIQVDQVRDPAFMAMLRVQLRRRARLVLGDQSVKDILITDFILQ